VALPSLVEVVHLSNVVIVGENTDRSTFQPRKALPSLEQKTGFPGSIILILVFFCP
jgi:hypothetical protein